MTTVILITVACLYVTGILIAAGDAWVDEHQERQQAHQATMEPIRAGSIARMHAARHRLHWSPLWPMLLAVALWRLRYETRPRHERTPHTTPARHANQRNHP